MTKSEGQQGEGLKLDILRDLLQERGMSPADLARETGIHKSTLSLLLSGKQGTTSAANLGKIAHVLGVSPDYLMGLSQTPEPTPLMLGELLLELTQVARKLTSRRQRDLLVMARAYLTEMQDVAGDRERLAEDMISLFQEHGSELDEARLFNLLDQAAAARAARATRGALLTDQESE